MNTPEEDFDIWWEEYKINKSDLQHMIKESFKEVAKDAWMRSDQIRSNKDTKEFLSIIMDKDKE